MAKIGESDAKVTKFVQITDDKSVYYMLNETGDAYVKRIDELLKKAINDGDDETLFDSGLSLPKIQEYRDSTLQNR